MECRDRRFARPRRKDLSLRGHVTPCCAARCSRAPLRSDGMLERVRSDNIAHIVGVRNNGGPPLPAYVFLDAVRPGGVWDYKLTPGGDYEAFGNFNYGATGAALGWSTDTLLRGAGAAQLLGGAYESGFGTPLGGAPFGDDPADQFWIQQGITYFQRNRSGP